MTNRVDIRVHKPVAQLVRSYVSLPLSTFAHYIPRDGWRILAHNRFDALDWNGWRIGDRHEDEDGVESFGLHPAARVKDKGPDARVLMALYTEQSATAFLHAAIAKYVVRRRDLWVKPCGDYVHFEDGVTVYLGISELARARVGHAALHHREMPFTMPLILVNITDNHISGNVSSIYDDAEVIAESQYFTMLEGAERENAA